MSKSLRINAIFVAIEHKITTIEPKIHLQLMLHFFSLPLNYTNLKTLMNNLPKFFDYKSKENEIIERWIETNVYQYDASSARDKSFMIDTPPPTVSGVLHMGHIFSYVQADIIARYQRMHGKNVFYPIGFDDNGLPTERLVEKMTGKKVGKNCTKDEFVELCYNIVNEAEEEFEKLFKKIGLSVDWKLKYQTISEKTKDIAHKSFFDLYTKGLIYKKSGAVYWDVIDQTALSHAVIEDKELRGIKVNLQFRLATRGSARAAPRQAALDGNTEILEVMTTRPEMLPACVAVFYNPNDERYLGLGGQKIIVPHFNKEVPLIADESIKIDKGTGLMMCCTYGDWMDVELTKKHNLKSEIIISADGYIVSDYAKTEDGKYLKIADARKKIVEILQSEGLCSQTEEISHPVKCGERSGFPVEVIETEQWYVSILPFKEKFLEISKQIKFYPEHMRIRLEQWIEGLKHDWCISRQRFFGIEIPIKGEENLVLDTWFTSSVSPQIAFGDFENCPVFDLRPQAHEIIRTWMFDTIVKSYFHNLELTNPDNKPNPLEGFDPEGYFKLKNLASLNQNTDINYIPWRNVMLSGWCLASDGSKMSKSKGNVVTPIKLIEEKGSDVIRFWCSNSSLGADTSYSEPLLDVGKKLITKLWNVAKFIGINSAVCDFKSETQNIVTETSDKWILSRLHRVVEEYDSHFSEFEYSKARAVVDDFFWNDLCDNYLEIIKVRYYGLEANIYKENPPINPASVIAKQKSCTYTSTLVFEAILKLYAPFIPYITEELYNISFQKSVHARGNCCKSSNFTYNESSIALGNVMIQAIEKARKIKTEQNLSMNSKLETLEVETNGTDISSILEDLRNVTGAISVSVVD